MKKVSPKDLYQWINAAIVQGATIVVLTADEETREGGLEASYFKDNKLEGKLLQLINEDDERYSFRGIIDVKAEIQKCANNGETGINIQAAKKAFPDLHI